MPGRHPCAKTQWWVKPVAFWSPHVLLARCWDPKPKAAPGGDVLLVTVRGDCAAPLVGVGSVPRRAGGYRCSRHCWRSHGCTEQSRTVPPAPR